jgi:hypothetical protein
VAYPGESYVSIELANGGRGADEFR